MTEETYLKEFNRMKEELMTFVVMQETSALSIKGGFFSAKSNLRQLEDVKERTKLGIEWRMKQMQDLQDAYFESKGKPIPIEA